MVLVDWELGNHALGELWFCLADRCDRSQYKPDYVASSWELLLIFYPVCILTFLIFSLGDRILPQVDAAAAI